jgi:hypothetical protein
MGGGVLVSTGMTLWVLLNTRNFVTARAFCCCLKKALLYAVSYFVTPSQSVSQSVSQSSLPYNFLGVFPVLQKHNRRPGTVTDHCTPPVPQASQGVVPQASQGVVPQASQGVVPQASQSVVPQASQAVVPQASESVVPQASQGVVPQASQGVVPQPVSVRSFSDSVLGNGFVRSRFYHR